MRSVRGALSRLTCLHVCILFRVCIAGPLLSPHTNTLDENRGTRIADLHGTTFRNLPCVFFAAQVGQDVRDVCNESGFDGFLAKPADRDAIQAELERLAGASTRKAVAAIPSRPGALGGGGGGLTTDKSSAGGLRDFAGGGLSGFAGMDEGSFLSALDFDTPRPDF